MGSKQHIESFKNDVLEGFTSTQKKLSSKYFYDDEGSRIFQDIMNMPEYYLTDCEYEIFVEQAKDILKVFANGSDYFHLVELGSGDGLKTRLLISEFLNQKALFKYIPIDISHDSLSKLQTRLIRDYPQLSIEEKHGDYFAILDEMEHDKTPKIILFLGSNIGNYNKEESIRFFKKVRRFMNPGDKLFIGMDLKKSPRTILDAYDDRHGHTARFNLNLLQRINKELGGEFDLTKFEHHEVYDPNSGAAKSYLVSLQEQNVRVRSLAKSFKFKAFETIYTEQSQKYDEDMIKQLASESGFKVINNFYDQRRYFVDSLWQQLD